MLESLERCFLVDGLPYNLRERMQTWKSGGIDVGKKLARRWSDLDDYGAALEEGWKQYRSIWKEWEGPREH